MNSGSVFKVFRGKAQSWQGKLHKQTAFLHLWFSPFGWTSTTQILSGIGFDKINGASQNHDDARYAGTPDLWWQ